MTIQLKDYEVEIKDSFTWGDKEKIQNVYLGGAEIDKDGLKGFNASVVGEAKYVLLEIAITEIKDKEGKILSFSKEWMNNLSIEDGDTLYEKIDEVLNVLTKKKALTP